MLNSEGPDLDLPPDVHSSMLTCTGTFGTFSYLISNNVEF